MNLEPGKYLLALREEPNRAIASFTWDGKQPSEVVDHLDILDSTPEQFESQVLRLDLGGYYVVRKVGDEGRGQNSGTIESTYEVSEDDDRRKA